MAISRGGFDGEGLSGRREAASRQYRSSLEILGSPCASCYLAHAQRHNRKAQFDSPNLEDPVSLSHR